MILENIQKLIQEAYIFSDKTISVDLHKFESGEVDKLLISGLSGGGKTSTGNYLKDKYSVPLIDTDDLNDELNDLILSNKRCIISGIGIAKRYSGAKVPEHELNRMKQTILNSSFIFLGKSLLKSSFDGYLRNRKKENNPYSLYDSIKINFNKFYKNEMQLRKDRCAVPQSVIKEFSYEYNSKN